MRDYLWICVMWWDVRGNRYWWLVAVDQHTDYTVIAPCLQPRESKQLPRRFSNIGFGGPDLFMSWCATEGEAWELLRYCPQKTLSVRNSGANNNGIFSVAEGSSFAEDRQPSGKWCGQDDFATPSGRKERHV